MLPKPPPDPSEAAAQVAANPALLGEARQLARSAVLLTQMSATTEEGQLLSRALDALDEPVDLPTAAFLISRAYLHAGKVMQRRLGQPSGLGTTDDLARIFAERQLFMLALSQQLAARSAA